MRDIKLRIFHLFFGGIGLAFFLSMLTADFLDPTIFNLLYPSISLAQGFPEVLEKNNCIRIIFKIIFTIEFIFRLMEYEI